MTEPSDNIDPAWSPDGAEIAFASKRDVEPEIYTMNPDGTNVARLTDNDAVDPADAIDAQPAWSPDGTKIAFISTRDGGRPEIYVMNANGTGVTRLTTDPAVWDCSPAWSPDGTKIAIDSYRSGEFAIWVMNTNGANPTCLTCAIDGEQAEPGWTR